MIKKIFLFMFLFNIFAPKIWADEVTVYPIAPGHFSEWAGMTGCTYGWDCADEESPDADTSYLSINTLGQRVTFFCTPITFTSVDSLKISINSKMSGLGATNIVSIGYSWTDGEINHYIVVMDSVTVTNAYTYKVSWASTVDENGNPWTATKINNHGFGLRRKVTNTNSTQLTQLKVIVWGSTGVGGKNSLLLKRRQKQ